MIHDPALASTTITQQTHMLAWKTFSPFAVFSPVVEIWSHKVVLRLLCFYLRKWYRSGSHPNIKIFSCLGIPMLQIRWSRDRVYSLTWKSPYLGKTDGLSTETGPMCYGDMSWNNINWRINCGKVNFGRVSCHEPMLGVSQCQIRTSALQLQYARKL